jgi:hypothetical protein
MGGECWLKNWEKMDLLSTTSDQDSLSLDLIFEVLWCDGRVGLIVLLLEFDGLGGCLGAHCEWMFWFEILVLFCLSVGVLY